MGTGAAEQIAEEIRALVDDALGVARMITDGKKVDAHLPYQTFYTKGLAVLRALAPDRLEEFVACYHDPRRKSLTRATYGVRDLYDSATVDASQNSKVHASNRVVTQAHILQSVAARAQSVLADIRSTLQAEVLDEDLDVARHLLKSKHVRAAGAVAGVVLERHLGSVAAAHGITVSKRSPTIADLNDPLRDAGIYDMPQWRGIQRLADIRNLAVHNKDREPRPDEVSELIDGAEKIVKTVF